MMRSRRWVALGAATVLGLGALGAGAIATANALDIRDVTGSPVDVGPVLGESSETTLPAPETGNGGDSAAQPESPDHGSPAEASVVSAIEANSPASPASAQSAPSAD